MPEDDKKVKSTEEKNGTTSAGSVSSDLLGADTGKCPQCGDLLIYPRCAEPYCEECGWPDEDFGA